MKPFYTLFAALLVLSALRAQTPWTSWNIYRDSTGNGANPVSGGLVCPNDTLWLVVDTTGMRAAGITGYRWVSASSAPKVVHCTGSPDCPSNLPASFPLSGVRNIRKIGIEPNFSGAFQSFALVTYYSNGDSAIISQAYQTRGAGGVDWQLPDRACAGSTLSGRLVFSGHVDSIHITYGSTTIRNQTDFTVTLPLGSGDFTITATLYFCGSSRDYTHTINYYPTPPAGPQPVVNRVLFSPCPNTPLEFGFGFNNNASLPSGYTSFVWKVNGNSVDPSSTSHPLSYTWTPPGPGTYTISYEANYPCGTMTGSTTYTVNNPPPPSWSSVSVSPNSYCPGMDVTINAQAGPGLHTLDIGNDGSIEEMGTRIFYQGPIGAIPQGGLPIRIRFDNGCGGIKDTLFYYNPSTGSGVGRASILLEPPSPLCGQVVEARLNLTNFPADSIRQVQWSWDGTNWTSPSNSLTALLTAPATRGPWTLHCRFMANSPANCLTPPASPVVRQVPTTYHRLYLDQATSFCAVSGGVVRVVPDGDLTEIDSIRYILPNGTSVILSPMDTLVLTVPPGTSAYPITYYGYIACGSTRPETFLLISSGKPFIHSLHVYSSPVCAGSLVNVEALFLYTQTADSAVVILWNGQRVPMTVSRFSARTEFSAPMAPGYYNLTVIAYNCAGTDTVVSTFQVTGGNDAIASFTAPASACVGQPVTFQRNGTNAGILYASWSFGDGRTRRDTSMRIVHTYTAAGNYIVTLSIQSLSCDLSYFWKNIRVYDAPPTLSGLSVIPNGLTINYGVASASDYDQIVWDFGDGNTASGVLSGTHTYASAGTYTVQVRAINACDRTELSTTVSVTTGLLDGGTGTWIVYPNPTRQEVFLTHPTYQGDLRVEIYDLTGRLIQTETLSSYPARVRLSLPNGIYTLRLISREGIATSKLLIE